MPLKVVTRRDTGTLWIVGTVTAAGTKEGLRIRRRAGSDDPALAAEEAAAIEREIIRNHHLGHRPVERHFAAAVASYLRAEDRSAGTIALAQRLLRHFGQTLLREMSQERVDDARSVILRPGAGSSTWGRTVALLSAIMSHAARRGWCELPRYEKPAEAKGRTAFLLPGQYESLESAAAPHLRPLLRYLICTGARLGETLSLEWSQVDLTAARVVVWADQTKAGRSRVIDLPPAAVAALAALAHREGHLFRTHRGEAYADVETGGGQLRTAWGSASAEAGLPGRWYEWRRADRPSLTRRFVADLGPHHLRHTWATWHYALHRDLLLLKAKGDWSALSLCERYAHLMPAGHEEAIRRIWGISGRLAQVVGG